MTHQVVPGERLLQHDQAEGVELRQKIDVGQAVCVVGVRHERGVGERLAYRANELDIRAGLDLELDFPVSRVGGRAGLLDQVPRARLNPYGYAGRDPLSCPLEKVGEAHLLDGRGEPPTPHLDSGLGHVVASEILVEHHADRIGGRERNAEHPRRHPLANGEPGGVDGFRRVVGELGRHTLGPGLDPIAVAKMEQEDPPAGLRPRRDLERLLEG